MRSLDDLERSAYRHLSQTYPGNINPNNRDPNRVVGLIVTLTLMFLGDVSRRSPRLCECIY